jgi:hypothetical protein
VRTLTLLIAVVTLSFGGCEWFKGTLKPKPVHGSAIPEQTPETIVNYLNHQSAAIQSIEFDSVNVSAASGPLLQQMVTLEGDLYCAKPRDFRLRAGLKVSSSDEVDIGSNDKYFWMFAKRVQEPNYVFCSYDDFATGKAQLPIPFDTDWVLQALGMTTYDPSAKYTIETRQSDREYWLISEGTTPQGMPVKKITVVAADARGANAPWVKKHVVMDGKGKTIATAEIVRAKNVTAGTDPQTGRPTVVQIPTELILTFQGSDNQKMKLNLTLGRETINAPTDERKHNYLFTKPTIPGSNPVNLADYRFSPTARGQAPSRSRR